MAKEKTIKIKPETHKRLCDFGRKDETFDQLFNRLLDIVENITKRKKEAK